MERVKRRWWTRGVSVLAALVIAAAALSGAFQFAVLALPSYRNDLSAWVTNTAGRPIQIGGIDLVWHSFLPQIDLSDITLYSVDGKDEVLSAERLSLGFGLLRLITGDFTPTSLELSGLSLDVVVDDEGKVSIAGLDDTPSAEAPDYKSWLKQLARFKRLRLQNCEIDLTAPHLPDHDMHLLLTSAEISKTFSGSEVTATLVPPAEYAKNILFEAEVADPVDQPEQWAGRMTLTIKDLLPQPWLRGRLLPESQFIAEKAELILNAAIGQGRITGVDARLETGRVQVTHAQQTTAVKSLDVLLHATPLNPGWQFQMEHWELDGDNQIAARLRYVPLATAPGYELSADADLLHLNLLTPWLAYWRDASPALHAAARSSGEISALQLRLTQQADALSYTLHAQMKDMALASTPSDPGFSQLSGELSANETSGRFELGGGALVLQLPKAIKNPIPFDALGGVASWQRAAGGWQIKLPAFNWKLASTQGAGSMNLLLPDAENASPVLDLTARFSATDVTVLKPYMPLFWGADLHAWLDRSILSGQVPKGDLTIKGPLNDFPFDERKTGAWKLDLDAQHINLAFLPEWPRIDQIGAHLRFQGNGLDIAANTGLIAGNTIENTQARFKDFSRPVLEIDGSVKGEMSRFYDFVRHSPLKKELASLIANTSASGPGRVAVHLDIPLENADKTKVSGSVQLADVNLIYRGLGQTISGINGEIGFNADGAFSDKLSGRFEDLDLTAKIQPQPKTSGVVKAEFDYSFNQEGKGASAYVPESLRHLISGSGHWRAELPLGADNSALTLSSDLQGIALALPEPLGKAPSQPVPFTLQVIEGAPAKMRVRLAYADRLGADISLAKSEEQWKTQGINLVLGSAAAPVSIVPGVFVTGSIKELDLKAWAGALGDANQNGLNLRKADLQIGRAVYEGQGVRDIHAVVTPDAEGWGARLSGAGAEGDLLWRNAAGGVLYAHLKHFDVDFKGSALTADTAATTEIFDPNHFPVLTIDCEHFNIGGQDFGNLMLGTSRVPNGQKVDRLKLSFGKVTLGADGEWTRQNNLSSAVLKFDLQSPDVASVLSALGYAPNLDAKQSRFTGDLNWPPLAQGVSWELARGRVGIDVKNGVLKSVDPGAGRVLGLLNFYALPRRLLLDFGDVVKTGLAFDTISGNFDLADGNANTSDLDIKGPSLRMEIRGRVGLSAQDLDQQVSVHPDYGSGLAVGATVAGGPIAGVIVLLAQQILQKPLDQITELNYRITGPWDNPKIESGSGSVTPPAPASKP